MMKIKLRSILSLLLAMVLVTGLTAPALAAETATTMKLTTIEGTVTVRNASGRDLSAREGMRLASGYTVETGAASYVRVNLDDTKLVKLDASTKVEIRKSGKHLEVMLISGSVYVDVSKKLESDETLKIPTSTAVVGIRGTKLTVKKEAIRLKEGKGQQNQIGLKKLPPTKDKTAVKVIEGTAQIDASRLGPQFTKVGTGGSTSIVGITGGSSSVKSRLVGAGKTGTVTVTTNVKIVLPGAGTSQTGGDQAGEPADVDVTYEESGATAADIPGFAQTELTRDGDYDFNGETITQEDARQKLAEDEAAAAQTVAENTALEAESSAGKKSTDPAFKTAQEATPVVDDDDDDDDYDPPVSADPAEPEPVEPEPEPVEPEPVEPDPPAPTQYYVAFYSDTEQVAGQTVTSGGRATRPADPTKDDGSRFMGWYTDTSYSTEYNFSSVVTGALTLYARWADAGSFIITYDPNGGTVSPTCNVIAPLSGWPTWPDEPVRAGHIFTGWYLDPDSETNYGPNPEDDTTLYAHWWPIQSVMITFVVQSASCPEDIPDGVDVSDIMLATSPVTGKLETRPTTPEIDGYKVVNWYDGTGSQYINWDEVFKEGETFTAVWMPI